MNKRREDNTGTCYLRLLEAVQIDSPELYVGDFDSQNNKPFLEPTTETIPLPREYPKIYDDVRRDLIALITHRDNLDSTKLTGLKKLLGVEGRLEVALELITGNGLGDSVGVRVKRSPGKYYHLGTFDLDNSGVLIA